MIVNRLKFSVTLSSGEFLKKVCFVTFFEKVLFKSIDSNVKLVLRVFEGNEQTFEM